MAQLGSRRVLGQSRICGQNLPQFGGSSGPSAMRRRWRRESDHHIQIGRAEVSNTRCRRNLRERHARSTVRQQLFKTGP
jgi:hypothetical protein